MSYYSAQRCVVVWSSRLGLAYFHVDEKQLQVFVALHKHLFAEYCGKLPCTRRFAQSALRKVRCDKYFAKSSLRKARCAESIEQATLRKVLCATCSANHTLHEEL